MNIKTIALASLLAASPAVGQEAAHDHGQTPPPSPDRSQMDHSQLGHDQMDHGAHGHSGGNDGPCPPSSKPPAYADGSGTSRLPGFEGTLGADCSAAGSHRMPGLHAMTGDWMLMAHGYLQFSYTDHRGPRGDQLGYSTSMLMLGAMRKMGGARLSLRSMLSLEPTMSARGYPNLFATGETAGGEPLVDRQHPHDLFMELAARLDVDIAADTRLFVYGGPVGEPSIGPAAFMHRGSAHLTPEPPITHHWFDSTHITYGVVTAGVSASRWQIEASAFRGREPDEDRWDIETPKLDSWSARLSWTPTPKWAAQVSHAFLKQPETLHGDQNEHRTTASVQFSDGKVAAMAAFSAKNRDPGPTLTAWLGEITYSITPDHNLFGRIENVLNDELIPDHHDPLHDKPFRVTKAEAGYAWSTQLGSGPLYLALGGSLSVYGKPTALDAIYGSNPWGYTLFARLSLGR